MKLSDFILGNLEPLLLEWDDFARFVQPPGEALSEPTLRDHARLLLVGISEDMEKAQTDKEQRERSLGHRERGPHPPESDTAAEIHAEARLESGFTLSEMVAEYRALRASVTRRWMALVEVADRPKLQELTRFNAAIDQDVTESVARYSLRVERARNLLLGALGHDLRNPLGAMLQSAHLVMRPDCTERVRSAASARIVSSGARMTAMISDLLDFARTRLGDKLPLAPAPMNLCDSCKAAVDEIAILHDGRPFSFDSPCEYTGKWDRARVEQMLSNLVGNAAQHGKPGTPVRVTAGEREGFVCVSIHNEGDPIPRDQFRRIFEPLARGSATEMKTSASGRSLGLGLYIAREIAKAHGGRLELSSSNESGTVFTALLPWSLSR